MVKARAENQETEEAMFTEGGLKQKSKRMRKSERGNGEMQGESSMYTTEETFSPREIVT